MDKQAVRETVWDAFEERGEARFPFPPHDRIPNFAGADAACDRLTDTDAWASASTLKCNPDAPQLPCDARALRDGKTVYVAQPRLRDADPFLRIDPADPSTSGPSTPNPPMSTPTARPSTTPPPSRASRRTARPSLPRTCRTSTSWSPAPWASRPTAPESGRVRGTATSSGAYSANSAPSTERRKAPLAARDRVPRATGLRPVTVGRSPTTARPLSRPRSTSCRSSTGLSRRSRIPPSFPRPTLTTCRSTW